MYWAWVIVETGGRTLHFPETSLSARSNIHQQTAFFQVSVYVGWRSCLFYLNYLGSLLPLTKYLITCCSTTDSYVDNCLFMFLFISRSVTNKTLNTFVKDKSFIIWQKDCKIYLYNARLIFQKYVSNQYYAAFLNSDSMYICEKFISYKSHVKKVFLKCVCIFEDGCFKN